MKKFLVNYMAPASVMDEWMKKPEAERKMEEQKMQEDWKKWMQEHITIFVDKGAGVGKTKRITKEGTTDGRNDIMIYAIVEAESQDEAAKMFEGHPHFDIPEASIEIMALNPITGMDGM